MGSLFSYMQKLTLIILRPSCICAAPTLRIGVRVPLKRFSIFFSLAWCGQSLHCHHKNKLFGLYGRKIYAKKINCPSKLHSSYRTSPTTPLIFPILNPSIVNTFQGEQRILYFWLNFLQSGHWQTDGFLFWWFVVYY